MTKLKPSLFLGSRRGRASVLTVFTGTVLLLYALLPRIFPTDPRQAFHQADIPREPGTHKLSEQPYGSSHSGIQGLGLADVDESSITDKSAHRMTQMVQEGADKSTQFAPGCLRLVLYDKPVKTGSTAVTYAIREYLKSTGRLDLPCNMLGDSCVNQSQRVCMGIHKRQKEGPSFLGHFRETNGSTIECLKKLGYYAVTSIRDPYQRRKSAYLYNKTVKGGHYSIPHTASFEEFMERLPRCVLHHYYDGLGSGCDVGITIEERVRRIVERYDEVIELGETVRGPLFRKIDGFIERENESHREEIREKFNESTLKEEMMLYNALREKMLRGGSDRVPC